MPLYPDVDNGFVVTSLRYAVTPMPPPPPPPQPLPPLLESLHSAVPLHSAVQTQLQESTGAVEKKRRRNNQGDRPNLDDDDSESDSENDNDLVFVTRVPKADENYDFSKYLRLYSILLF